MTQAAKPLDDTLGEPAPSGVLAATDRCDRCSAQAYVAVAYKHGTLLFCGHHFGKHELSIMASNPVTVHDERWVLRAAESKAVA